MAGQNFNITIRFASGNGQTFQGVTTVTPPAAGNNPQNIDQIVSAANALANPGVASGDQKIALGFPAAQITGDGTDDAGGGGFGFAASLVTAGSGTWSVVIKFVGASGVIKSYTLTAVSSCVARDAIGAHNDLGTTAVTEIDVTPSADGAVVELMGILNLNL
jgi:hypothetical protein